jgi:hypothetical protein
VNRAPWRPIRFSRAHRIDIGGGPPSTISTRRFWGALWRWYAKVVFTVPSHHHGAGRHAVLRERRGYSTSSPHGQPLVVTIGARGIGVTGDLDGDRGCPMRIGRRLDDLAWPGPKAALFQSKKTRYEDGGGGAGGCGAA